MAAALDEIPDLDLGQVVAQLAAPVADVPVAQAQPLEYAPVGRDFGGSLATHFFSPGLVVAYTVEQNGRRRFVTESMRIAAGVEPDVLLQRGRLNLGAGLRDLSFNERQNQLEVGGYGSLTASLVLVDEIWESDAFMKRFPTAPVVAIGTVDMLLVCDRASPYGLREIRRAAREAARSNGQERALTEQLLVRDRDSQTWGVLEQREVAVEQNAALRPFNHPVGPRAVSTVQDRQHRTPHLPVDDEFVRGVLALTDAMLVGDDIPLTFIHTIREQALSNLESDGR